MAKQFEPGRAIRTSRTDEAGVVPAAELDSSAAVLLCGDCGLSLLVVNPCRDGGLSVLRCGCGAEIHPSAAGV